LWTKEPPSPLGLSDAWAPGAGSPLFYRSIDLPFGDSKTNYVLGFKPHSQFRFGFSVPNNGDSPVRIDGVAPPSPGNAMLRVKRLLFQHDPHRMTFSGATEEPLTIEPGDEGFVIPVLETGGPCAPNWTDNGAESWDSIHLRYRYRGHERTEWYSMPVVIGIVCGDPKTMVDGALGTR
jgi:hypothetical protein